MRVDQVNKPWTNVTQVPYLADEDIHIFRLDLDAVDASVPAAARRHLLRGEQERADRIRLESARNEFICGRAMLRAIVSAHIGSFELGEGVNGKPCITSQRGFEVNVSHSSGMILVAISRAGPVGVDVEFINPRFATSHELLEIAKDTFDSTQFSLVEQSKSESEILIEFYRAWTRKESVAKADGRGIAEVLDYRFKPLTQQVFTAGVEQFLVSVAGAGEQLPQEFYVQALGVGERHVASFASIVKKDDLALFSAASLFSNPS